MRITDPTPPLTLYKTTSLPQRSLLITTNTIIQPLKSATLFTPTTLSIFLNKTNTPPNAIMTRGEGTQTKVHLKKNDEDYIIFVESEAAVKEWKASDNTVALAQVVDAFKIFTTHKYASTPHFPAKPIVR